jgi:hypothetical protein
MGWLPIFSSIKKYITLTQVVQSNAIYNSGYVFFEMKESFEKYNPGDKNNRTIVLGINHLSKMMLFEPKLKIDNFSNLSKVMMLNKHKELFIEHTSDNRYNFEIKVTESDTTVISNIELLPEDMILIKKYASV